MDGWMVDEWVDGRVDDGIWVMIWEMTVSIWSTSTSIWDILSLCTVDEHKH
jgi:hypothetical protein